MREHSKTLQLLFHAAFYVDDEDHPRYSGNTLVSAIEAAKKYNMFLVKIRLEAMLLYAAFCCPLPTHWLTVSSCLSSCSAPSWP